MRRRGEDKKEEIEVEVGGCRRRKVGSIRSKRMEDRMKRK